MIRLLKTFFAFALLLGSLAALPALDKNLRAIADDSALRTSLFKEWFLETPQRVLAKSPSVRVLPGGERVEVRTEMAGGEFSIVLARELGGSFPGWAKGSWSLTRDAKTGAFIRLRFFPRSDPYTYIQFRPLDDSRSLADAVVYDAYLAQNILFPIPFERILTANTGNVLETAEQGLPMRYYQAEPDNYRDVRALIQQVRQNLGGLRYADDGAIDEAGNYVFIDTLQSQDSQSAGLNCSGFVKWLADGLVRPLTGKSLAIAPLKAPFGERGSSFTSPYERTRDPFFGLDWIRNIAKAVNSAYKSPDFGELSEFEVNRNPFSELIIRDARSSRTQSYPGFLTEAGFGVEGLQALLYTLAIDEPGYLYLGAVNNEMPPKPRMRQYFHTAALLPYFDEHGVFHIAVFESAAETSFNRFRIRYPGNYINLVRIPVESDFQPGQT
jgi:hypothetical protein